MGLFLVFHVEQFSFVERTPVRVADKTGEVSDGIVVRFRILVCVVCDIPKGLEGFRILVVGPLCHGGDTLVHGLILRVRATKDVLKSAPDDEWFARQ